MRPQAVPATDRYLAEIPDKFRMKAGSFVFLLGLIAILVVVCGCTSPGGDSNVTGSVPARDDRGVQAGNGYYVFTDMNGNADRPVTVLTYRPVSWNVSGPVLIVIPGASRSAVFTREIWRPYGDIFSCLIVVPEFPLKHYPDDSWYALGNLFDESGNPNPAENWTYMAIEHLFDDMRRRTGARQETYLLFGHSAGAQFVHRMVTFLPEARYSRAVAANAGVYLMPAGTVAYPFGLQGSPLPESGLPKVFSRKLIVMSGADDTNPSDSGLAVFPLAMAQGRTRLERAENYYAAAQREAGIRNVPLNWEYIIVPGVGHSEAGMAGPSAVQLFAPR